MSVNFPTDRPGAGLGSGPLQQGDSWRFGSIEYTWVITPDGTGIWSSKGINVNPNNYIAKADLFQANGGVISGSYNGGANEFAVSNAASSDDSDKLDGQDSDYYRNADNINSGTINSDRLPENITSNTSGKAATAGTADTATKVSGTLTIKRQAPDGTVTTVLNQWDGDTTEDITIIDVDDAQAIINQSPVDIESSVGLSINTRLSDGAKVIGNNDLVRYGSDGTLYQKNGTTKITTPNTTYSGGTGINIDSSNKINVTNSIARSDSNNYVVNGAGTNLRTTVADQTAGTLTIVQGGVQKGTWNGATDTIYLDGGGSSGDSSVVVLDVKDYYDANPSAGWAAAFNSAIADANRGDVVYLASQSAAVLPLRETVYVTKEKITIECHQAFQVQHNGVGVQLGTASSKAQNCRIWFTELLGQNTTRPWNTNGNQYGIQLVNGSFNTIDFNNLYFFSHAIDIRPTSGCIAADNKILGQLIEKNNVAIYSQPISAKLNHCEHTMVYTNFIAHYVYGIYKSDTIGSQKFWDVKSSFDAFPAVNPNTYLFDIYDDYVDTDDNLNASRYECHFTSGGRDGNDGPNSGDDFGGQGCLTGRNCFIVEPIRGTMRFSGHQQIETQDEGMIKIITKGGGVNNGVWVEDDTGTFKLSASNNGSGGYVLPVATAGILGGVRVGNGLSVTNNGILSVTGGGGSGDSLHRINRFNIKQEMLDNSINATTAFNRAITWVYENFDSPSIYFPSGTYDISSVTMPYNSSKQQITIWGDGGRGEATTINCSGALNIGHPVNINSIKFVSKYNGTTLQFRRIPPNNAPSSQPLEDDMDSTITNCVFGNGGSEGYSNAVDIDYRGRNLEVKGCRFVTGGATGKAIKLSYFCNTKEAISQDELGWKRIMISDNNFHNFDAGCIEIGSSQNRTEDGHFPKLRGLVLANNTLETDGVFLIHSSGSNCRLEGAVITGNTLIAFRDNTVIDIQEAHACAITGNTFNGFAEQGRLINVNIDTAKACTLTGNVFNSGQGSGLNGALSGNNWTACVVSANTWFGSATGRININNPQNCEIQQPVGTSYED